MPVVEPIAVVPYALSYPPAIGCAAEYINQSARVATIVRHTPVVRELSLDPPPLRRGERSVGDASTDDCGCDACAWSLSCSGMDCGGQPSIQLPSCDDSNLDCGPTVTEPPCQSTSTLPLVSDASYIDYHTRVAVSAIPAVLLAWVLSVAAVSLYRASASSMPGPATLAPHYCPSRCLPFVSAAFADDGDIQLVLPCFAPSSVELRVLSPPTIFPSVFSGVAVSIDAPSPGLLLPSTLLASLLYTGPAPTTVPRGVVMPVPFAPPEDPPLFIPPECASYLYISSLQVLFPIIQQMLIPPRLHPQQGARAWARPRERLHLGSPQGALLSVQSPPPPAYSRSCGYYSRSWQL